LIVFRKELTEIVRDRRTLIAIGLAALVTPIALAIISQVSAKVATQSYTLGYRGDVPTGLDILLRSVSLDLKPVADPAKAAKTASTSVWSSSLVRSTSTTTRPDRAHR
jgi:ABC-type Na+ efflux pump permease subunit